MKMKRPRGMRELATIQGLSGRTVPSSREQIVAEQSRLEHERARLERELKMWQDNERRTGDRLAGVHERLALLTSACEQLEGGSEPPNRGYRPGRPNRPTYEAEPTEPTTTWHEVVLEY